MSQRWNMPSREWQWISVSVWNRHNGHQLWNSWAYSRCALLACLHIAYVDPHDYRVLIWILSRRSMCSKCLSQWWSMRTEWSRWIYMQLSKSIYRSTMRRSYVSNRLVNRERGNLTCRCWSLCQSTLSKWCYLSIAQRQFISVYLSIWIFRHRLFDT